MTYHDCNADLPTRAKLRKEGADSERKRLIKKIEKHKRELEKAGLFANGPQLRHELQTLYIGLEQALEVIQGEDE